jgi:hypothetical protein
VIHLVSEDTGSDRVVARGIGDSSLSVKWRCPAREKARLTWAVSVSLEFPTGNSRKGLGSALLDYGTHLVAQVRLPDRWTLRGNIGAILAGNWQIGAVGIHVRGPVVWSGASLVRAVGGAQVGGEAVFVHSPEASVGGSAASVQLGGNLPLGERTSLDFGILRGWLTGRRDGLSRWASRRM